MLLSAMVVLCCTAFSADVPKVTVPENSVSITGGAPSEVTVAGVRNKVRELPDSPVAMIDDSTSSNDAADADVSPASGAAAGVQPFSNSAVRPAGRTALETPRERNTWFALMAISHSAAVFDAYSTRRAISGNYGVEGNPLLRPFAHNNTLYVVTQVSPAVMDYLGHRMLRSHNTVLRRLWWLPQTAGAGFSVGAGIHNYRLVP